MQLIRTVQVELIIKFNDQEIKLIGMYSRVLV